MTETLTFPGLGLEIELSRVAFSIGPFTVYWYGVLIAAAFLAGTFYAIRRSKVFGVNADRAVDVVMISAVGGIIGARLYYVLFSWEYYSSHLDEIFKIWHGGIAIYGGVIGALITAIAACKLRGVKFFPMADMAVGGILLGQAIGRWGNFVNVEAFGSNTSLPWGMTSSSISAYLTSVADDLEKLGVTVDPTMPVHPTFFYESLWCLIGFGITAWLASRRRFDGELLMFYTGWYGAGRFVIEGLRTDSLMLGTIRVSQLLAGICVLGSIVAWIVVRNRIKTSNDPEYLKVYAKTEEAAMVISGEYYRQLAQQKKEAKEARKLAKKGVASKDASVSDSQTSTQELIDTVKSAAEEDIPLENPGQETRYPPAFSELVPLEDELKGVQGTEDVKAIEEKRQKKAEAMADVAKLPVDKEVKEMIDTAKTAAEEDIPLENPGKETRYPPVFSELVPLDDEMQGVQGTEDVRKKSKKQQDKEKAMADVAKLPVDKEVKEMIDTAKTAAEEDIPLENPGKETRYPPVFSELVPLDDEMQGVQGTEDVKAIEEKRQKKAEAMADADLLPLAKGRT